MTSYVNKRIIPLVVLIIFSACIVNAKETLCYKSIESSDPNIKVGAIQFISFIGDQCYESDVNGTSVKNGIMQKNGYQSSRNIAVYNGTCFCGSGAKFEFNVDKSVLTVTSKNKRVYKFKKIPKPQGVTTCSIIRKHNDNGDGGNPYYYVDNGNSPTYYPNAGSSNNNSNNNNTNTKNYIQTSRKCAYCNGTGQITKNDNAPANFGIDKPRQRCSTCGEWYNPNVFNHYHIRCSHCRGTGSAK